MGEWNWGLLAFLLGNTEATTVAPFNSATNAPILSSRSSVLIRSSGFPARAPPPQTAAFCPPIVPFFGTIAVISRRLAGCRGTFGVTELGLESPSYMGVASRGGTVGDRSRAGKPELHGGGKSRRYVWGQNSGWKARAT